MSGKRELEISKSVVRDILSYANGWKAVEAANAKNLIVFASMLRKLRMPDWNSLVKGVSVHGQITDMC